MRKLMLALIAGCMSAAVASAYAASGSPADTDKAGRASPGTAAGEQGAAKPDVGSAGTGMKRGATGAASSTTSGTTGGSATTSGTGGSSASAGMGDDTAKSTRRSRRAARAEKG